MYYVDLVPRSCFGGSRTKKWGRGEGKGEEEMRSGKIRIEASADWLFHNGCKSSTRVLFLSVAVPKTRQRSFIEPKKKLSQLCLISTEHDKMYLIFSDAGKAVKLESLIKTLGKIHVSGEDGLLQNIIKPAYILVFGI